LLKASSTRVARCFLFKPKIPIWVNFGGPLIGKCCYILQYLTGIWDILWPLGTFCVQLILFLVWLIFTKKNLATPSSTTYGCKASLLWLSHPITGTIDPVYLARVARFFAGPNILKREICTKGPQNTPNGHTYIIPIPNSR
jgi:hypothetical protein